MTQTSGPNPSQPWSKKKRKRKTRQLHQISKKEAARAIYFDFEGRAVKGEPPVLVGFCVEGDDAQSGSEPPVVQYLLDRKLDPLLELAPWLIPSSLDDVMDKVIERAPGSTGNWCPGASMIER